MTIQRSTGPANPVWVERTGPGTFEGHNPRGARVALSAAGVEGEYFTPGELLKVALAACSAVTAEAPLVRALGEDLSLEVRAEAASTPEHRYEHILEEMLVDLSGLDQATRERVLTVVQRAVDAHCTVGRTVEHGAHVTFTVSQPAPRPTQQPTEA